MFSILRARFTCVHIIYSLIYCMVTSGQTCNEEKPAVYLVILEYLMHDLIFLRTDVPTSNKKGQ